MKSVFSACSNLRRSNSSFGSIGRSKRSIVSAATGLLSIAGSIVWTSSPRYSSVWISSPLPPEFAHHCWCCKFTNSTAVASYVGCCMRPVQVTPHATISTHTASLRDPRSASNPYRLIKSNNHARPCSTVPSSVQGPRYSIPNQCPAPPARKEPLKVYGPPCGDVHEENTAPIFLSAFRRIALLESGGL